MIYLRMAMTALGASGVLVKLAVGAGLVVALLAAYGAWHHHVFRAGYLRAVSDIAADDAAAIGRASKMRDSYQACAGRNGSWDQTAGRCR